MCFRSFIFLSLSPERVQITIASSEAETLTEIVSREVSYRQLTSQHLKRKRMLLRLAGGQTGSLTFVFSRLLQSWKLGSCF